MPGAAAAAAADGEPRPLEAAGDALTEANAAGAPSHSNGDAAPEGAPRYPKGAQGPFRYQNSNGVLDTPVRSPGAPTEAGHAGGADASSPRGPQPRFFGGLTALAWVARARAGSGGSPRDSPRSRGSTPRGEQPPATPFHSHKLDHSDKNARLLRLSTSALAEAAAADEYLYEPRWYIIDPGGKFRKFWDLIQAVILVYVAMVVPVRVGLQQDEHGRAFQFDVVVDAYWYLDVVLNFFTAYERTTSAGDQVVTRVVFHPRHVAVNYLTSWFAFDVVACCPVDLILASISGTLQCSLSIAGCGDATKSGSRSSLLRMFKLLRLFRLVKLLRLVRMSRIFQRWEDDLFKIEPLLNVLKLLFAMLFVAHLAGCFFYFFSQGEWLTDGERALAASGLLPASWIQSNHLSSLTLMENYIAAMYWAFTTVTTVGYGDISANTMAERCFAIIAQIMGGFGFSVIVASITAQLSNLNKSAAKRQERLDTVSVYVRDRDFPKELRRRIIDCFRSREVFAWDGAQAAILRELPQKLRMDILTCEFAETVKSSPLFLDAPPKLVGAICHCCTSTVVNDAETVYAARDLLPHLYLIVHGEVTIMEPRFGTVHCLLGPGAIFGIGALFGEAERPMTARASAHTTVLRMRGVELAALLADYPDILGNAQTARDARRRVCKRHSTFLADSIAGTFELAQYEAARAAVAAGSRALLPPPRFRHVWAQRGEEASAVQMAKEIIEAWAVASPDGALHFSHPRGRDGALHTLLGTGVLADWAEQSDTSDLAVIRRELHATRARLDHLAEEHARATAAAAHAHCEELRSIKAVLAALLAAQQPPGGAAAGGDGALREHAAGAAHL